MKVESVISTPCAVKLDGFVAGIHGMTGRNASMAINFMTNGPGGLQAGFHCSTDEARAFAAELIRHADVTDAAQAAKANATAELPAA